MVPEFEDDIIIDFVYENNDIKLILDHIVDHLKDNGLVKAVYKKCVLTFTQVTEINIKDIGLIKDKIKGIDIIGFYQKTVGDDLYFEIYVDGRINDKNLLSFRCKSFSFDGEMSD